jgi:hypothetical protein
VLAFSSFSPKLKTLISSRYSSTSEVMFRTNLQRIKIERERKKKDTKQLYRFLPQTGSSHVPLHFQGEFTKM